MPVEWAIAQSDTARLDRFTARCRVPLSAIQLKPLFASQYVLVRPAQSLPGAFLGRVAIADADGASTPQGCVFDPMVSFDAAARPSLLKKITGDRGGHTTEVEGLRGMHWVPRELIRNAVGVTLEIEIGDLKGGVRQARELLADASYKQLLQETLQHQIAVCKLATVRFPLPEALRSRSSATVLTCRVVSTYPAEDIVRVTMNTRVTITIPEQHDLEADSVGAMQETNAPAATHTRVGGLEKELEALREMIMLPVKNRSLQAQYNIEFPKGALLCGPPGVGKTLLVRTAVEDCRQHVPLHLDIINGSEIMTSGVGDAEQALRDIFKQAATKAQESDGASVIFIDELDALCPKRDSHGTLAHSRVVAQLLTLLDGADKHARANVLIVGATNLPNNVDPALRRPGRFDREIFVSPPDVDARTKIFKVHMSNMPHVAGGTAADREAFIRALAVKAIGYVGADIAALCREALSIASTRQFVELTKSRELEQWWSDWKRHGRALHVSEIEKVVAGVAWKLSPIAIPVWFLSKPAHSEDSKTPPAQPVEYFSYLFQGVKRRVAEPVSHAISTPEPAVFQVTMDDFDQAMQVIVASAIRSASGVAKGVEQLGWDDIGGQEETKLALQQALEWPIKFPQTFSRLGITPPRGILLYGPPGCSKSTVVRAAAHSSGATFLSLSAAHVFSPFFGDAEASVRQVFRDARTALPAIVFFDEIDVLVTKREFDGASSGSGSGSGSTALRVLSTMLNEMDGVESADGLLVIGATNRPDCIDAALLRPGRFDRVLFVDLPTVEDRLSILKIHTRRMTLHTDVDLRLVAAETRYFSGAELENVCREAALHALRESITADCVCMRHLLAAVKTITPVSSPSSLEAYHEFAARMSSLG